MAVTRRAFLTTAALAGAAGFARVGAQAPARRSRPCRRRATGRGRSRSSIPIPTSSRSTTASAATSSATRSIKRLHTGTLWAEGPAWNGVGRYLVWSDIPNNVQMRWIEEDGRVTVFRNPSGYSNGNTFDYEGRQLSCEHGGRRVVRYEHERHGHGHRRQVPGQAAELAERRRRASGRRHLVHRSDLRHPRQLRRVQGRVRKRRKRSTASTARRAQIDKVTDDVRRAERPLLLARLQEALRRRHRHAARHQGVRRRRQGAAQRQAVRRSSTFPAPARRRPPTASAATSTATSGRARGPACRSIAPDGDAHRHDPPAGDLRQRLLRRRHAATGCS